jgi:hypothetical protein
MNMNKPNFLLEVFKSWLPLAAGLTIVSITAFTLVQQLNRLGAAELPAQVAYDAQQTIFTGRDPAEVVGKNPIELSGSLAPFLMVFDESEKLQFSSVTVFGKPPVLPEGVLAYTRTHFEDRITWQPSPGVRAALVIVHMADGGFVAGGQSIAEPERIIEKLEMLAGLGWIGTMGTTLVMVIFFTWLSTRQRKSEE